MALHWELDTFIIEEKLKKFKLNKWIENNKVLTVWAMQSIYFWRHNAYIAT